MNKILERLKLGESCLYQPEFPPSEAFGSALICARDQYTELRDTGGLLGGGAFTFNFWIKLTKPVADGSAILKKGGDIKVTLSSSKSFFHYKTAAEKSVCIWSDIDYDYTTENYIMLTLRCDGKSLVSYVDGQPNKTLAADFDGFEPNDENIMLGGADAHICDFAYFDRALSDETVFALFDQYDAAAINRHDLRIPCGAASLKGRGIVPAADAGFDRPDKIYRQIQYNVPMKKSPDVQKLADYGMGGVVLAGYHDDYMEPDCDWQKLKDDMRASIGHGLRIWIYDEDNFPTGGVGGILVKEHPEYEVRGISAVTAGLKSGEETVLALPEYGERFIGAVLYEKKDGQIDFGSGATVGFTENRISCKAPPGGDYVLCGIVRTIIRKCGPAVARRDYWKYGARYGNLLDENMCETYLELTQKQYKDNLGELYGSIDYYYTNEPQLGVSNFANEARTEEQNYLAYADSIFAEFEKLFGYDVTPHLLEILTVPMGTFSRHRQRYFQTVGHMLARNFFDKYRKWCGQNGGGLSGHLILEEHMAAHVVFYGNFMQCMSKFHIPGLDHYIYNYSQDYTKSIKTLKFSLSSARHLGNYLAQGLYEPIVSGCYWLRDQRVLLAPALDVMRKNLHQMLAAGISYVNSYNPYEIYGKERFREYSDYLGRFCYLLRGARDKSRVAVYYNIETVQGAFCPSHIFYWTLHQKILTEYDDQHLQLCGKLFRASVNFNYIAAFETKLMTPENGKLKIGEYEYEVVIMPSCKMLPFAVARKLAEFERQGGTVLWIGELPDTGDFAEQDGMIREYAEHARKCTLDEAVDKAASLERGITVTAEFPDKMYFSCFEKNGRQLVFIANDKHKTNTVTVSGPAKRGTIYFPDENEIRAADFPFTVGIGGYRAIMVEY